MNGIMIHHLEFIVIENVLLAMNGATLHLIVNQLDRVLQVMNGAMILYHVK